MVVDFVNQMKHINTLRGKVQSLNFKAVVRRIYRATALSRVKKLIRVQNILKSGIFLA